jgi:hypothetical protein
MKPDRPKTRLKIGQAHLALERKGRGTVVAAILGDRERDGRRHLVLDRRIHQPGESELDGWACWGPVVTELLAPAPSATGNEPDTSL